jgi:hypothetical protein
MIQMAYLSSTPVLLGSGDIADILVRSRANNAKLAITGLLVYRDGNVLQFLEGEAAAVRQLFARIARDSRHRGVIPLYEKQIEQRDFAEWTMGFTPFATEALEYIEGYDPVLENGFDLSKISGAGAQKLIRVFKATVSEKSA